MTHAHEKGLSDLRSDEFVYCYLYGLFIHKLGHFNDILHGTRSDGELFDTHLHTRACANKQPPTHTGTIIT